MRLWLKYLVGIALGIASSFVLPANSPLADSALAFFAGLTLKIGRYMVIPLLFFGAVTAVYRLRDAKMLAKASALIFACIALSTLLLAALGVASVAVARLPRIPVSAERFAETPALGLGRLVESVFPPSAFAALTSGECLLPAFFLACLLGGACAAEKARAKPFVAVCDSASKVCYVAASFISDVLAVGMIAVACRWSGEFFSTLASGTYTPLLLVLTLDFAVVAGGVYPLLLWLFCRSGAAAEPPCRPYRVLYAGIAPALAAFFSGDALFALSVLVQHGKESLGIRRRLNAYALPLFSLFGRSGAALASAASFALVLASLSPAGVSLADALWIVGASSGLSFLLVGLPSGAPFVLLAVLCSLYGRDVETGYLLLRPAAVIVSAYGAALDAVSAIAGTYFVAFKLNMTRRHGYQPFI
jgi:Na+/H+-dicarboxylate symporter